jgi:hypothetical protein
VSFKNLHLLIRLNGGFGSAPTSLTDKWSCGFRIGVPGTDIVMDTSKLQTLVNAIQTAASTAHTATNMQAGTNCYFTHVTGARVGTDGKYNPAGQVTTVSSGVTTAGGSTPTQAWNTAHSIGLRTGAPRGYASNGRYYYPIVGASVTSVTGRLSPTVVTGRLTAFRTFFQAVNVAANAYDPGAVVCVMSNVGAGTTLPMIALRADERLDSIERRENDSPSTYTVLNM